MVRDMTAGSPSKILVTFALPMILGNVFQQLYNIVDSVVVGNFVGSDALAAVGASYPVTFLFIAVATGASIGCSVVISQFYGAKRITEMKSSVFTALTSMMTLSALLLLAGLLLARPLLLLMRTPGNIFSDADAYLRIYVAAVPFLFLYNTSTAAFNALGDSRTPLWLLMLSSVTNIFLDLLFVIRFGMGVPGVAWATLIAQALASLLAFFVLLRRLRRMPCEGKPHVFECERLRHICRVAVPSIVQQSIVSFGALFVQALVNGYGSDVIAGYTAATKIDSIAIMPMLNVGNAVSSFTAQNIGAAKPGRVG
ncbi:MATE family efflux transporter, partial [Anaerotruncus massiliensis (ex Liu et al. 2021)]